MPLLWQQLYIVWHELHMQMPNLPQPSLLTPLFKKKRKGVPHCTYPCLHLPTARLATDTSTTWAPANESTSVIFTQKARAFLDFGDMTAYRDKEIWNTSTSNVREYDITKWVVLLCRRWGRGGIFPLISHVCILISIRGGKISSAEANNIVWTHTPGALCLTHENVSSLLLTSLQIN